MKIFVLWFGKDQIRSVIETAQVATDIQETFSPLFENPPQTRVLSDGAATLVSVELPVIQWTPAFFEQQGESWAFAPEYPINARSVLNNRGIRFTEHDVLLTLCRCLQEDPESILRELVPPFSLIWSDDRSGDIYFQNDGLGMAQLFEYKQGRVWALSNRIQCLKVLGLSIEPEPIEWATRFALGWFPLYLTGYKQTTYLAPGTQGHITPGGIKKKQTNVLTDWVHPNTMSENECLELGRSSMLELVKDTLSLCEGSPNVGLSGGWDSRLVVALLRASKADFSLRVRGLPERLDVIIAHHLAKIAGIDIAMPTQSSSGLPPDDAHACKRCITQALLWQSGYMFSKKHKVFLAHKKYLETDSLNIMGQHAGIAKADYARKICAEQLQPSQYAEHFMEEMMKALPPFTLKQLREPVRDLILESYNQADAYGLTGLAKLDFYFLFEYTRRASSGSLNSQRDLKLAPFLNPGLIRACYAYPAEKLPHKPFHRYITDIYAPDWKDIPYEGETNQKQLHAMGIDPPQGPNQKANTPNLTWKRTRGNKKFNEPDYWEEVGAPIIFDAIDHGGFWTSVFDPDLVKQHWRSAPDQLAIAHLLPESLK